MGGLGNQLFQIFATIAYAIEHKHQFIFPYEDELLTGVRRPTYWCNFLKSISFFTTLNKNYGYTNDSIRTLQQFRENGFNYKSLPVIDSQIAFSLYGYYQSYKYFEKYQDKIFSMIKLDSQLTMIRNSFIYMYPEETIHVSMHFRLGDYKEKQQYHPVMPREYYEKALAHIVSQQMDKPIQILYFCEEDDNDIVLKTVNYLKNKYVGISFVKVDDKIEDWKQMLMMSCCHHHIIANSSYSWWGAYLNKCED